MRFNPIALAVAALCGGSAAYRAPGRTAADEVAAHPIAALSRIWGRL